MPQNAPYPHPICNILQKVLGLFKIGLFRQSLNKSQVDANVGYWQVTAGFLKLNYWDFNLSKVLEAVKML